MKFKGWEKLFEDDKNRWEKPNPYINLLEDKLKKFFRDKIHVLDVGYGAGRHIIYFNKEKFLVSGFDIAPTAKNYTEKLISLSSNKIDLKTFDMNQIPWLYKTEYFEGVIAINVIHHTNYNNFTKIIHEIARIMVKDGLFLATIASKENYKYKKGKKIDEYTFLTDIGAEKGIPHCFLDKSDITKIFTPKFQLLELRLICGEIPQDDIYFKNKIDLDHWLIFAQRK